MHAQAIRQEAALRQQQAKQARAGADAAQSAPMPAPTTAGSAGLPATLPAQTPPMPSPPGNLICSGYSACKRGLHGLHISNQHLIVWVELRSNDLRAAIELAEGGQVGHIVDHA